MSTLRHSTSKRTVLLLEGDAHFKVLANDAMPRRACRTGTRTDEREHAQWSACTEFLVHLFFHLLGRGLQAAPKNHMMRAHANVSRAKQQRTA
jgi:hypothetical protein